MLTDKFRYLNPLTDYGFKKLFGSEPNKFIMIDFLNQLLPKHHQIKDLTYSKNEQVGATPIDRKAIYDLFCTNENGDRFIVEVQKTYQDYFLDRSIFYSTFPIQEQAQQGEWNFKLAAVYTIAILNFTIEDEELANNFLHEVRLKDKNNHVVYDKLTYIYIELPKFIKTEDELLTRVDKWFYVLKHLAKLQDRPKALQERVFQRLFEAAEIAMLPAEERINYENSVKNELDWQNTLSSAQNKAKEERSHEIARNLKQKGATIELIAVTTELSVEEIEKL